jgi:hypothetical protein
MPLEVTAVKAGIPSASLSRFERGEHQLSSDQVRRLNHVLETVAMRGEDRLEGDTTPALEVAKKEVG